MWLKSIAVLVVLSFSSGFKLLDFSDGGKDKILIYLNSLIKDLVGKNFETHEVAILKLPSDRFVRKFDELVGDILKVMPKSVSVHLSPSDMIVQKRNLRASSLIIIVSDIFDKVKEKTL